MVERQCELVVSTWTQSPRAPSDSDRTLAQGDVRGCHDVGGLFCDERVLLVALCRPSRWGHDGTLGIGRPLLDCRRWLPSAPEDSGYFTVAWSIAVASFQTGQGLVFYVFPVAKFTAPDA